MHHLDLQVLPSSLSKERLHERSTETAWPPQSICSLIDELNEIYGPGHGAARKRIKLLDVRASSCIRF